MARIELFESFFNLTPTVSHGGTYRHRILVHKESRWADLRPKLKRYFRAAHADAVQRIRRLLGVDLHPLKSTRSKSATAMRYPYCLEMTTLKGYFGEILAYAIVESLGAAGHSDWEVPAFLFRYHVTAFQRLEAQRASGGPIGTIVGRTGDDGLAFRRNKSGHIIGFVFCEAKCTATHDASLISDAHEKIKGVGPADIPNLIEVLLEEDTAASRKWVSALRTFRESLPHGTIPRIDFVCYVYGQQPILNSTWIEQTTPHTSYGVTGRTLDAVEVHFTEVEDKIQEVYSEDGWQ